MHLNCITFQNDHHVQMQKTQEHTINITNVLLIRPGQWTIIEHSLIQLSIDLNLFTFKDTSYFYALTNL